MITERPLPAAALARVSEPKLAMTAATLDLRLGAVHLDARSADLGDVLVEYAGHRPVLSVDRVTGRVRARQAWSWLDGPHPPDVEAVLSSRLPWILRIRAAGMSGRLDLRRLQLGGLDVSARSGRFRADLPAPSAAVMLRIAGQHAQATLSVPEGTSVRFWQEHGWEVEGHRSSGPVPHDRYDVWLDGSSGHCRVETRSAQRPRLYVVN